MRTRYPRIPFLIFITIAVAFLGAACTGAYKQPGMERVVLEEEQNEYTLEFGDPSLRNAYVEVGVDDIIDAATGRKMAFDELISTLADADVVYLAESHTSWSVHQWQDRIIRALHERGAKLKIGMEFFQRSDAEALQRWVDGWLTERGLLYLTGWYAEGGYNFGYYRPFITFARDAGIPVFGINIPRSIVRAISRGGVDSLEPEQREMIGAVNLDNEQHRALIMHFFGGPGMAHGASDDPDAAKEQMNRLYAAQSSWDSAFADSVIAAHEDWDGVIAVILGSGHLAYNLGSNRVVRERSDLKTMTVMPVTAPGASALQRAARSYGDVLIGVPEDTDPAQFPDFGLRTGDHHGAVVVGMLFPGSPALEAGVQQGDVVLALDGEPVRDTTDMRIRLSGKAWGDSTKVTVRRGGEELVFTITPRRESE